MIDEAAELEARDEAHWMHNDAHGVEDCLKCAELPLGTPPDPGCPWCGGRGTLPRREAEHLRGAMERRETQR